MKISEDDTKGLVLSVTAKQAFDKLRSYNWSAEDFRGDEWVMVQQEFGGTQVYRWAFAMEWKGYIFVFTEHDGYYFFDKDDVTVFQFELAPLYGEHRTPVSFTLPKARRKPREPKIPSLKRQKFAEAYRSLKGSWPMNYEPTKEQRERVQRAASGKKRKAARPVRSSSRVGKDDARRRKPPTR